MPLNSFFGVAEEFVFFPTPVWCLGSQMSNPDPISSPLPRPVVIYDGECSFCCKHVSRWKQRSGEKIEFRSSQEAASQFRSISEAAFARSVQWVEPDGRVFEGARAVFRVLAAGSNAWRGLLPICDKIPLFWMLADRLYYFAARNRSCLVTAKT